MSDEQDETPAPTYPIVVKLRVPVEMGSERIEQLTFRRGILRDMKGIKLGDDIPADAVMLIASRMCGHPVTVIEKLDVDDAGRVMRLALSFFKRCLTTGGGPSPS